MLLVAIFVFIRLHFAACLKFENADSTQNFLPSGISHLKTESMIKSYSDRFSKGERASPFHLHTVVFAIKKLRMDELRIKLEDISDPFSSNYGNHLTRSQITSLTSNFEGKSMLIRFLENHSQRSNELMKILKVTPYGDFVFAQASVKLWESFFDTEFFFFHSKNLENSKDLPKKGNNFCTEHI